MKSINTSNLAFTPGSAGVGTVTLSGISNFDPRKLLLITNQTRNTVIYATGTSKGATSINGNVVTLSVDTSSHDPTDKLQVSYDSGTDVEVANGELILQDSFSNFDTDKWTIARQAGGDIISVEGNTGGARYLTISLDPLSTGTVTTVESKVRFNIPVRATFGLSRSLTAIGKEFATEIVTDDYITTGQPVSVAYINQLSNTNLVISTFNAHNYNAGDSISIDGMPDSRFNFPSLVVDSILSPFLLSATGGPNGTSLPSTYTGLTAGTPNSFIYDRARLGLASNGTSMIFENTSHTNASFYTRYNSGQSVVLSGRLINNHSMTIASNAGVPLAVGQYTYALNPVSIYEVIIRPEYLTWSDKANDSQVLQSVRVKKENALPDSNKQYKIRFRATNNMGLTLPAGKIKYIAKGGATATVIETDIPHGLTTADAIGVHGVFDAVNFPNTVTAWPILSVVGPTSLQISSGGAIAASYGGFITKVDGGNLFSNLGLATQSISSIERSSNVLRLSSSGGAWSGFSVGDFVNVYGLLSSDGSLTTSCNVDGAYRVNYIVGYITQLEPITTGVSPTGADFGVTNCAGSVIKRNDLRIHQVKAYNFNRFITESYGGVATGDTGNASTVYIAGTVSNMSTNIAQIGGNTVNTAGANGVLAIGGNSGIGSSQSTHPVVAGSVDQGGLARQILSDNAGGLAGPGEFTGTFTFGAVGGGVAATDGTNSKTFYVPAKDSVVYLGLCAMALGGAVQLEGSHDNQAFSVIPLSRVDNTASSSQYTASFNISASNGSMYKGNSWGYPILRVHQTVYGSRNTIGSIRVTPNVEVAGQTISPFTIGVANTTEAAGTANGAVQVGGVRTLAISNKGSNKAVMVLDSVNGTLTMALEGSSDAGATYNALSVQSPAGGPIRTAVSFTGTFALPQAGIYEADVSNMTHVRARCTAYTSGSASGALKIVPVAASNGVENSYKATYSISQSNLSATAAAPVFMIESGASKVTRLKRLVIVPGTATNALIGDLVIARTSGAGTGFAIGSLTLPPVSAMNREVNDPPFSGTVRLSGFNWTGVTSAATTMRLPIPCSTVAATSPVAPIVYDFTNGGTEKGFSIPVGTTNGILLQHSGLAGNIGFGYTIEWTEE